MAKIYTSEENAMFEDFLFVENVKANGDSLFGAIRPELRTIKKENNPDCGKTRCVICADVKSEDGQILHVTFWPRNEATEKEQEAWTDLKVKEVLVRVGYFDRIDAETQQVVETVQSKPKVVAVELEDGTVMKLSGEKIAYKPVSEESED